MKTLALIGVGRWGSNIVKTIEDLPGLKLKYLCARTERALSLFGPLYEKVSDYHELLLKGDIDAAIIATPPKTHAEIAIPFIEKKIPVFIEKPLALSLDDALAIEKAAQENAVDIFVGHIHLYSPAYRKVKEILAGDPVRLIVGEGGNNGPYREDYSVLWDWVPHDLSVTLDLLEEMPSEVTAFAISTLRPATNLYDLVSLKLSFPSGTEAFIRASWLLPEKQKRMMFIGQKDSLVFDDMLSEKKITLFEGMGPEIKNNLVSPNIPKISYPAYDSTPPLKEELRAFQLMLEKGKSPLSNLRQGISVVRILEAAERSIRSGSTKIKISPEE